MISIEYALDKYTDLIHEQQKIDLNYFKNELNTDDYKEFLDEIKYIKLINANRLTKSFNKLFEKLNNYKNELYVEEMVVNFRGKDTDTETIQEIEEIFNKEFKDE